MYGVVDVDVVGVVRVRVKVMIKLVVGLIGVDWGMWLFLFLVCILSL